jgi:Spy/CpxP family protein refolding chaperone
LPERSRSHSRLIRVGLIAVLALLLPAGAPGAPAKPTGATRWWRSPVLQSAIGLSPKQVRLIDAVYDASVPQRRRLRQTLDRLHGQLDRMLTDGVPDEARARGLVERIVTVQRESNTARTMLLVRIYQVLTPGQRTLLATIPFSDVAFTARQ